MKDLKVKRPSIYQFDSLTSWASALQTENMNRLQETLGPIATNKNILVSSIVENAYLIKHGKINPNEYGEWYMSFDNDEERMAQFSKKTLQTAANKLTHGELFMNKGERQVNNIIRGMKSHSVWEQFRTLNHHQKMNPELLVRTGPQQFLYDGRIVIDTTNSPENIVVRRVGANEQAISIPSVQDNT